MTSTLLFVSYNYIDVGIAGMLLHTYPLIVMVLSILLNKERFNIKKFIYLIITTIGIFIMLDVKGGKVSNTGVILVLLGFLPKIAAIVNSIPQPVLGGVGIVMFGTVAAAGIKTLSKVKINERNLLIIATSIGLGLGVTFRPEFISQLPEGLKMIFASGISTGTITALILNIILKEETV